MINEKNIIAQISLLDDNDDLVYNTVRNNLIAIGLDVIPILEKSWENLFDDTTQSRIEEIIKTIQSNHIKNELIKWKKNNSNDLLYGSYLIAKTNYPDLEYNEIYTAIEKIKDDAWLEFNENLTALEKIRIINHILFQIHKFFPNTPNFFAPQNSYINLAIENKKANTITLAIIYLTLAEMLNMPVYGVDLPNNLILAYVDPVSASMAFGDSHNDHVLFYINPFNKGSVFSRREIDFFLSQKKIEQLPEYYKPCSNITIIERLIDSLYLAYSKAGYADKTKEIQDLLIIIKEDN